MTDPTLEALRGLGGSATNTEVARVLYGEASVTELIRTRNRLNALSRYGLVRKAGHVRRPWSNHHMILWEVVE